MKCCKCSYYKRSLNFNMCDLLNWECYRELNDCNVINDDGSINEVEYKKVIEYM